MHEHQRRQIPGQDVEQADVPPSLCRGRHGRGRRRLPQEDEGDDGVGAELPDAVVHPLHVLLAEVLQYVREGNTFLNLTQPNYQVSRCMDRVI